MHQSTNQKWEFSMDNSQHVHDTRRKPISWQGFQFAVYFYYLSVILKPDMNGFLCRLNLAEYISVAESCCYGLWLFRVSCLGMCVIYCQRLTSRGTNHRNISEVLRHLCYVQQNGIWEYFRRAEREAGLISAAGRLQKNTRKLVHVALLRFVRSCCVRCDVWFNHHVTVQMLI